MKLIKVTYQTEFCGHHSGLSTVARALWRVANPAAGRAIQGAPATPYILVETRTEQRDARAQNVAQPFCELGVTSGPNGENPTAFGTWLPDTPEEILAWRRRVKKSRNKAADEEASSVARAAAFSRLLGKIGA